MAGMNWGDFSQPLQLPNQKAAVAPARHSGGLASFLPLALSLAGGAVGTVLAPGVGTAAGGAGGGLLGQKLEDMITGNHSSAGAYAMQGGLGALGGVGSALKSIGAAGSAVRAGQDVKAAGSALKFGSEGSRAIEGTQGLSAADKVVMANEANAGAPGGLRNLIANKADKTAQSSLLSQTGGLTKQTAESAVRDVGKMQNLGYNSVDKMAAHAPIVTGSDGVLKTTRDTMLAKARPIDATGFKDVVAEHIGNNVDLTPAQTKNISTLIDNLTGKYKFAGEGGNLGETSASNFDLARRDLMKAAYKAPRDSAARNTLLDIGNSMRAPVEESLTKVPLEDATKQAVIKQLQSKGINNKQLFTAINNSKTASDLSAIEAPFVTASQMGKEGAESSLRSGAKVFDQSSRKITGMANEALGTVVGAPAKKVVSGLTSKVSNLVKPGESIAPSTVPGVVADTAKGAAKVQIPARLLTGDFSQPANPSTNPADLTSVAGTPGADLTGDAGAGTGDITGGAGGSDVTGAGNDQLKMALKGAMIADLQNGGKNVPSLTTIYKLIDAEGKSTLSADEQKRVDNMGQSSALLQEYYNQLQEAGGGKGLVVGPAQSLLGKVGLGGQSAAKARALNATRVDIATSLAQAMTGNSRPAQQQVEFWMQSIPQLSDPQAVASQKLKNTLALIEARKGALTSSAASQSNSGSGSGMTIDDLAAMLGGQ